MVEDKAVSNEQVKQIAKRALDLERYILRRAWGLCYAVFAVEIALIISFDILFSILKLSPDYHLIVQLAFNTSVSIFGAAIAAWVFKKSYDAMLVRREIVNSVWARLLRPSWVAAVWVIYYLPVFIAIVFLRPIAGDVLYGILAASVGPFYFSLKVSSQNGYPVKA